ncbi:MAG: polysaccharide biosynthesis/export family protein [Deltaproteobacteria bacterium]|nr:polysaccharide biosynthesis/export family protein [Deltaproteobacteria bacterium]MBW1922172.1 polysaccharide biosynthesis/export family protein [Deltaproteobacteria bacterium]MBW1951279.1 polysaccharide biosynthesis/export family protein [Deltaproteobacteria bacterium]MBW2006845.1 polysaccharide biosynthesis/export family protein [Deltaproteobacteria bacterium]MBW2102626.1 polysaccharide biosynthesis/export family protein [Deltaproteobacteria bacterium]
MKSESWKKGVMCLVMAVVGLCLTAASAPAGEAEPEPYLIGPNDVLSIYVWKEPELTRDVTVMSDGRISYPLIGEIMAAGRTVTGLREAMSKKLEKFVTAPEVTVIVAQSRSRVIYTIGKLNSPGPFALAPRMTVLQALSTAGGFAEWADTKNILIIRREGDKEIRIPFNYKDFISGDNVDQNILLRPNDTIVVP